MNNTFFIFLIRRDHALQILAHLAAGIVALVLLTGLAAPGEAHLSPSAPAAAAPAQP